MCSHIKVISKTLSQNDQSLSQKMFPLLTHKPLPPPPQLTVAPEHGLDTHYSSALSRDSARKAEPRRAWQTSANNKYFKILAGTQNPFPERQHTSGHIFRVPSSETTEDYRHKKQVRTMHKTLFIFPPNPRAPEVAVPVT
jgi:hypothetical protein